MKILVIDDSFDKMRLIATGAKKAGIKIENVVHKTNIFDALLEMRSTLFDLVFVDIQIPEDSTSDINVNGGVEFIEHLELRDEILKPLHIIAITSHHDAYISKLNSFLNKGWGVLSDQTTPENIKNIIEYRMRLYNHNPTNFDIAIITALVKPELEAVLNLSLAWERFTLDNDPTVYYKTSVTLPNESVKTIVACSCPDMGMVSASSITTKLCIKFNPEYIYMCGISAGIKGKVNLGDIIVGETLWDWGFGKLTISDGAPLLQHGANHLSIDNRIKNNLKDIQATRTFLELIYKESPSSVNRPHHQLSAHIGPMASGSVVLEDPDTVAIIKSQQRNILAIEMEGYGVMAGAELSVSDKPKVLIIKSICDFADPEKNDNWQEYAAYTSARYAYELIKNNIFG
jgi:nucleoside phosphorylase